MKCLFTMNYKHITNVYHIQSC